jgi:hypothetical protein
MAPSNSTIHFDAKIGYAERLREAFRRKGWRVDENPRIGSRRADMAGSKNGNRYLVELKAASEGRRDRLIPLRVLWTNRDSCDSSGRASKN